MQHLTPSNLVGVGLLVEAVPLMLDLVVLVFVCLLIWSFVTVLILNLTLLPRLASNSDSLASVS